jgi:large subunit ribosomal protein L10
VEDPRPEKVAVVDEVRGKLADAEAVVFTEYRGLTVRDLQELRASLRSAGGEYRVYKNTLVRRASEELDLGISEQLTGPTALTFVGTRADGTPGDAVLVAKALKAFSRANPTLVIKGGLLGGRPLNAGEVQELAEVAPREELLARLAGGLAAPMRNMAALLQAVPAKFAYGLQALIDAGGAPGAPTATPGGDAAAPGDAAAEPEPEAAEPDAAEAPAEATDEVAGDTGATDADATTEDATEAATDTDTDTNDTADDTATEQE